MDNTVLGIDVSKSMSDQKVASKVNEYADVFSKQHTAIIYGRKIATSKSVTDDHIVSKTNDVFKQSASVSVGEKIDEPVNFDQVHIDSVQYSK